MGRAFSPRSVCDAILGRCPRLVWGAPLALRHTRFTRFMHARHPRHAWRGRRGRRGRHARRGRASTPRRFSTRCRTWRRMISMRASCMRDGAWTTRSSRREKGQRPASIPAWGNAPGFVMKNNRGLKARSMLGCVRVMDRAFSPRSVCDAVPWALPKAGMGRAVGASMCAVVR